MVREFLVQLEWCVLACKHYSYVPRRIRHAAPCYRVSCGDHEVSANTVNPTACVYYALTYIQHSVCYVFTRCLYVFTPWSGIRAKKYVQSFSL